MSRTANARADRRAGFRSRCGRRSRAPCAPRAAALDTAATIASANNTSIGVPELPSCCLIVASWASIADHSLASRSGSRLRWVWCMPVGLSTQRRTDTAAFCLSSSVSPSSPANRLASSRQRRSNIATGSTRANPNRASCNPARRSRPASSKPLAALATASTWPAETVPVAIAVSKPGIASHTSERSDAALVSRVERRP